MTLDEVKHLIRELNRMESDLLTEYKEEYGYGSVTKWMPTRIKPDQLGYREDLSKLISIVHIQRHRSWELWGDLLGKKYGYENVTRVPQKNEWKPLIGDHWEPIEWPEQRAKYHPADWYDKLEAIEKRRGELLELARSLQG